jgi:transcriptional regulator with XRE-family HTH domain
MAHMDETARARTGRQIRDVRLARGWSKTQLALAAGVSPSLVAIIEAGEKGASLDSIEKVAIALDGEIVVDIRIPRPPGATPREDFVHAIGLGLRKRLGTRFGRLAAAESTSRSARPTASPIPSWKLRT